MILNLDFTPGLTLGFIGVVVLVWPELTNGGAGNERLIGLPIGLLAAVLSAVALITLPSGWIVPDWVASCGWWYQDCSADSPISR